MNKIFAFYFLLLSSVVLCQNMKVEKLENWVFPQKNNFIRMQSSQADESPFRLNYFKLSESLIGTSFEVEQMNSDPMWRLFEIGDEGISLVKVKEGAFGDLGGEEYSFPSGNFYWKLPSENGKIEWNYIVGEQKYKAESYWKKGIEKLLVVVRIGSHFKSVEYYSENKGLVNEEGYSLLESGFDSEIVNENFPLTFETDKKTDSSPNPKDMSYETNEIKMKAISDAKKSSLSKKEELDNYYLEQYGRRYEDYQKMFKHLPERSIKKVKIYNYRLRKYITLNVVWFPRQEAINNQMYIDSKHRSTIFK